MSKIIVIVGPQGSGKGTLAKGLGFPVIELGAKLREYAKDGGLLYTWEQYLAGDMAPKELVHKIIRDSLDTLIDYKSDTIVFDGYPRNEDQARDFFRFRESNPDTKVWRLDLQVHYSVCYSRLISRGREDDTEEAINKRLGTFFNTTITGLSAVKWWDNRVTLESSDDMTPEQTLALAKKLLEIE